MKVCSGTILKDGSILENDGTTHFLPLRGKDEEGYPEVLMDATAVGGKGFFKRQSIKPFIGMKVEFIKGRKIHPFNHTIVI
jgi:hypothetical protein